MISPHTKHAVQVQACLQLLPEPCQALSEYPSLRDSADVLTSIHNSLGPQLTLQPLPQAPLPSASRPAPAAVPSAAAMAAVLPNTTALVPEPELPVAAASHSICSLLEPSPVPLPASAPRLAHAGLPPAVAPTKQEPLLQRPVLPGILGRLHASSLPSMLQLAGSAMPPATGDPELPQLSAALELDQLLEVDFTMRACPNLLPLPFLACLDAPHQRTSRACQLAVSWVPAQSTSHLELYLDWSSTSSALNNAVKHITEASPLPDPKPQAPGPSVGRLAVAAIAGTPAGLHSVASRHAASSRAAAKAWLSRCSAACLPQPGPPEAFTPAPTVSGTTVPCSAKPVPPTGLGYFISLQQRPQAALDFDPAQAGPQAGPQQSSAGCPAAETLWVGLPAPHTRLLQRLQACNADVLRTSTGLSHEVLTGPWLELAPVQAGLDVAAAAETARAGSHQHVLRAYAALLAVRHAGLCLLHFGIRCCPPAQLGSSGL